MAISILCQECHRKSYKELPKEYAVWMKSNPGEDALGMFINEYPNGGFEWTFLDYEPEDSENYTKVYISLEPRNKQ